MAVYYSPMDPAKYRLQQEQMSSSKIQNIIKMIMQMQMFKKQGEQWGEEQEFKKEQWTTRKPYLEAMTEAQTKERMPPNIIEAEWLRKEYPDLSEEQIRNISFDITQEREPALIATAKKLVEYGVESDIKTSINRLLSAKTTGQEYRMDRDEIRDFKESVNLGIKTVGDRLKGVREGRIDPMTNKLVTGDPQAIKNLEDTLKALREIRVKIGLGTAGAEERKLFSLIYSDLGRAESEGDFWNAPDEFGYKIGEIKEGKGMHKGKFYIYRGNNKWDPIKR